MPVRLTTSQAWITIACIWLFAVTIYTPVLIVREQQLDVQTSFYTCQPTWSPVAQQVFFLVVVIISSYVVPLTLISICDAMIGYRVWNRNAPGVTASNPVIYKSKVKALKMLLVVVVLFTFSWLPLYSVYVRITFQEASISETEWHMLSTFIVPIAQWLGSSNSCVNPIIYCFYSKKFRNGFRKLVSCCLRNPHRYVTRNNSATYFSVNVNGSAPRSKEGDGSVGGESAGVARMNGNNGQTLLHVHSINSARTQLTKI